MAEIEAGVVAFRRPGQAGGAREHPRTLMERVYGAGSLSLAAEDVANKMVALSLRALGMLVVEEVAPDGSLRPLGRGAARRPVAERPWRVSKPGFGGEPGSADAGGAFRIGPPLNRFPA